MFVFVFLFGVFVCVSVIESDVNLVAPEFQPPPPLLLAALLCIATLLILSWFLIGINMFVFWQSIVCQFTKIRL